MDDALGLRAAEWAALRFSVGGFVSFRRRTNRHDAWIAYVNQNRSAIAATGLPMDLFGNERGLKQFLTDGRRQNIDLDLRALSDEQFDRLFKFVTTWFDCDAADFTALEHRRLNDRPGSKRGS